MQSRFVTGEKADDEPVTLNHRRIFILPTHRGLAFVFLNVLLLLIAFVYNNNLAYLLAFLLAGVFFVTMLHSYKSLAGLVVQKGRSKPVFAQEAAGFDILIGNPTDMVRHHVQIALQEGHSLSMRAQSSALVTLFSNTKKRGWHEAGTVTLYSAFPLGLFRAWSPVRLGLKVLVYPKPSRVGAPFPKTPSAHARQGFDGKQGDDYSGLQEYQSGDAIRHIHWKAYAKGLGVFSKQYGGEYLAEEIWLDYANAPGHHSEERLSQLCRWVVDAELAGIRYGLALPGIKFPPGQGLAHYQKCLAALALF